jgi:hypothetical protein
MKQFAPRVVGTALGRRPVAHRKKPSQAELSDAERKAQGSDDRHDS